MRSKWFDRRWYRHQWWRVGYATKWYAGLAVLVLLGGLGYYVATVETSANASDTGAYIEKRQTVLKIVTVRKNGKTIIKRIPTVKTIRIKAKPVTVKSFQTVTSQGQVKKVRVTEVKYKPVTFVLYVEFQSSNVASLLSKRFSFISCAESAST